MREAREEEERRRNPVPPATLSLVDRLVRAQRNGRIRMSLLCGVAADESHRAHDVPRAVEALGCRVERLPEFGNAQFVYPPVEEVA